MQLITVLYRFKFIMKQIMQTVTWDNIYSFKEDFNSVPVL